MKRTMIIYDEPSDYTKEDIDNLFDNKLLIDILKRIEEAGK